MTSRHTLEQISRKLREGVTIREAANQIEVSGHTLHRQRNQCGGMKADCANG
jgi:hypothetical protein